MEVKCNQKEMVREVKVRIQEKEPVAAYEVVNQCLIIKLNKELDHHSSLMIREKTDKMLDRGNIKNIIFDFEQTSFMDSSGIGVIMGRYKRVLFCEGKVAVTNVCDGINRILNLSGLYKIIKKYASNDEAIKSF